ncbi:MAG: cytochrome c oxidase assembly protein [Nitriliruptoraceae bacterium]|nr:cytochrome c oxidase assembly protein [Nitriliruptoraceae bacterium]
MGEGEAVWVLDPPALAVAAGLTALYLRGTRDRQGAAGRAGRRRRNAFLTGVGVVVLASVSPVASLGEVLFTAHMVQHLLFVIVAAPLIAAGRPFTTVRRALPRPARHQLAMVARRTRRARRRIGDPPPLLVATATHVAVVWLWHAPPLYDAAVASYPLHLLEHATFLAAAVWFWSEVFVAARRGRRSQALSTAAFGVMIAQGALLGALITFAGRSLYASYDGALGFDALTDQQLGGALMWVVPGFVHGVLAIRRFTAWVLISEQDRRRRDQRTTPVPASAPPASPTPAMPGPALPARATPGPTSTGSARHPDRDAATR